MSITLHKRRVVGISGIGILSLDVSCSQLCDDFEHHPNIGGGNGGLNGELWTKHASIKDIWWCVLFTCLVACTDSGYQYFPLGYSYYFHHMIRVVSVQEISIICEDLHIISIKSIQLIPISIAVCLEQTSNFGSANFLSRLWKEFLTAHFQNKAKLQANRVTWDMRAGRVACLVCVLIGHQTLCHTYPLHFSLERS